MAKGGTRRRRGLRARTVHSWARHGGLAVALALLGGWSVARTFAWTQRSPAIERAQALAPGDGRITGLLSEKLAGPDAGAADRALADQLAREALLREPTSVAAVATLGLDAAIRGDGVAAQRLFAYSQKLSRRDLRTRVWAIEDAVGRGDVTGALRHYDIALRTSRTAPDLLFPVLTAAIADPAIRGALLRTLAAQPPWTQLFIEYATPNAADPRTLASLFSGLRQAGVPISDHATMRLVDGLVDEGLYGEAWRYYTALRPGADRRRSRDPRFAADPTYPLPFDWVPAGDAGISTSIERGDRGGVFDFSVPASVGGLLLRQMQVLPPGNYLLQGHGTDLEQPVGSKPYWTLACRDGREFGRVDISPSAQGTFSGRFSVPAGCPIQYLSLIARPSDMVGGVSGQIDYIQLRPER